MIYRISARGVLREDDKILFIEYKDERGEYYYSLPGGQQDIGESLSSTLKREFKEEVGINIEVENIVLIREFILEEPKIEIWKDGVHQVEIIFSCRKIHSEEISPNELKADIGMTGIKWIEKNEFESLKIYPSKDLNYIIETGKISYLFSND